MEPTVIATIISVLGAAVLGLFIYFIHTVRAEIQGVRAEIQGVRAEIQAEIQGVRAEIYSLGVQVNTRIDKLEERVGSLAASVAAIAATQAEHGVKLEHMLSHGERISALEGAVFGTAAT